MQMKHLSHNAAKFPNPLRKLMALIVAVVLVGLVLMFSAVLFVIILIAGALAWAYLWWKTRHLRKQMRDYPPRGVVTEVFEGEVIEGEVIRVEVSRDGR
jgi:ABC-type bacteriocin/lantibiotic exporter with double-glycine peptidase domain